MKIGTIHLFDLTIAVEEVSGNCPDLEGLLGLYDSQFQLIRYREGLNPQMQRNTLLHEALHPLCESLGIHTDDDEAQESLVLRLTTGILELMRKNPGLVRVLMEGVER